MHALDGGGLGGRVLQVAVADVAANDTAAGKQGEAAGRNRLEVGGTEGLSWVEEAATDMEPESDDDIVEEQGRDLRCDCRSGEAGGVELHDEE